MFKISRNFSQNLTLKISVVKRFFGLLRFVFEVSNRTSLTHSMVSCFFMNMIENICCFFLSYLKKKSKTIMSFSTINHFKNIISRNNTYHKVYNLSPCFQAYMKLKDLIYLYLLSYTTINGMILRPECLGAIFNFCSTSSYFSLQCFFWHFKFFFLTYLA